MAEQSVVPPKSEPADSPRWLLQASLRRPTQTACPRRILRRALPRIFGGRPAAGRPSLVIDSCLSRPARVALRAAFRRLPRAAVRAGGRVVRGQKMMMAEIIHEAHERTRKPEQSLVPSLAGPAVSPPELPQTGLLPPRRTARPAANASPRSARNFWRPSRCRWDRGVEVGRRGKLVCPSRRASTPVRAFSPDAGRLPFVSFRVVRGHLLSWN